jgi:hypothetical protein
VVATRGLGGGGGGGGVGSRGHDGAVALDMTGVAAFHSRSNGSRS